MGAENIRRRAASMIGVDMRLAAVPLAIVVSLALATIARAQDPAHIQVTDSPEAMETSTRERIQERLASIAGRLGECFGDGDGALTFDMTLNRDGVVQRLVASEGSDADAVRCVRPLLQRLRFDPLSASVTFPISVSPASLLGRLLGPGVTGGIGLARGGQRPTVRTGSAAVRGSLSREVIRRVIRRHINRVRQCYERALVQDPNLTGRINVRFTIAASGNIQSAAATHDTLGNGAVSSCVVQVVRTMRFPAPNGGGIVVVTYPFIFQPNTIAAAGMTPTMSSMSPTPVVQTGMAAVRGRLDRAQILRVVRRNQRAVRYCYERELQRSPQLAGRIAVRFEILPTGRVGSASVASDTLGNNAVAACVARQVRRWRFPQPEGGGSVSVTYPFVFSTRQ